jgi:hypothetical protein
LQIAVNRRQLQNFSLESKKHKKVAMLDFSTINHLSRCHCVAICAFLVPTNLLLSSTVILLTGLDRSPSTRRKLSLAGTFVALLLIAHVASWWIVGVVAPATFILPSLGLVCTAINWGCVKYSSIAGYYIEAWVLSRFRHNQNLENSLPTV